MIFNRRIPSWIRVTYRYDSFGGIFYGMFYGLTIAFFPIIARRIGASYIQMAILASLPFLGALLSFYGVYLSSARKKMPFVIRIKFLARVSLFLMFFAFRPSIFLSILALYWLLEHISLPAYIGIMKDIYPDKDRGKAMGYVRVELALTAVLSTYLGGFLLNEISYRYIFPLGATFGLLALHFFRRIRVESDQRKDSPQKNFSLKEVKKILKKDKNFSRYESIFFLYGVGYIIILPLCPIFLVDTLNLSNVSIGKLGSLFSLFWIFSYLFWGELLSRKEPLSILLRVMFLAAFIPLFYAFAFNIWLIVFAFIFSGFIAGGLELARITYLTKIASEEKVQKYWGISYTLMGIRGVIFPFVGIGLSHILGIRGTFCLSFFLISLSLLLMRKFVRSLNSVNV